MLTVRQFRELNEVESEGLFEKMIHSVSLIRELEFDEVANWRTKRLTSEYEKIKKFVTVSERFKNEIELQGKKLELIDFNTMTLGQFIDIETLITQGFYQNIHKIASSIYMASETGDLGSSKREPYDAINIEYRSQLIDEITCSHVYGACLKLLPFRDMFFSSYSIFDDELKNIKVEELDEEELQIYNEEMKQREQNRDSQWLMILNFISQSDITKFESILNTNLFMVFNQLTYLKNQTK
jgi:hypothetical protein